MVDHNPRSDGHQLALAWLPQQHRRRVDRRLRKLFQSDLSWFCGSPFKPNSSAAGGLDAHGGLLVQKVEPGSRLRAAVFKNPICCRFPTTKPSPMRCGRWPCAAAVPPDRQTLLALVEKYAVRRSQDDARL